MSISSCYFVSAEIFTYERRNYSWSVPDKGSRGSVVTKALCYNPERRGFETLSGKLLFSI
jgi:hypothetical protein